MEIWLAFIALAVVAAVLSAMAKKRPKAYEYRAAPILTKGERAFADALEPTLPAGSRLLAKVRVADLITPKTPREIAAFRKISQKHMDFVIADRAWKVIAAVELNDKSHEAPARRERDNFLRDAFAGAGVALHFVRAQARYEPAALTQLLATPEPPPTERPPQAAAR